MPLTIKSAVINYKDPDTGDYVEVNAVGDTAHVTDVQVNGTSVVTDNVANIPIGSSDNAGVVKSGVGIGITNDGRTYLINASSANVKSGTIDTKPIAPINQHEAVFYGLAKLAGVDMKNSSNPVGEFTDEAKVAIQKMLGIYEAPWELINEETFTNATQDDYIITTDSNAHPFELTDIMMLFELPTGDAYAEKALYGQIWFYYNDNTYITLEAGSYSREASAASKGAWYSIRKEGNMYISECSSPTTNTNASGIKWRYIQSTISSADRQMGVGLLGDVSFSKINITKVTGTGHYKLYGKRKWE